MKKYKIISQLSDSESYILLNDSTSIDNDIYIHEIGTNRINCNTYRTFIRNTLVIQFVHSGKLTFLNEKVNAGEFFVMFPNELVQFEIKKGNDCSTSWIVISGDKALELIETMGIKKGKKIYSSPFTFEIAEKIKKAIFLDYNNKSINYTLLSIFYEFLSLNINEIPDVKTVNKKADKYIEYATLYIKSNYSEPITPTDVAKSINLNTNYLCRLFKSKLNESIKQYITAYRIHTAQKLLINTNLSIFNIAQSVGYDDQMYFSQVFKKKVSCTPSEFRKRAVSKRD